MKTLAQAEAWLLRHTSYGGAAPPRPQRTDLEPIATMLAAAGNPQQSYPVIQITGTRGKGTTASFIAQLLTARGLKVGLFTSPHLLRLTERIRIGSSEIKGEEFATTLATILELPLARTASFFDLLTAVAAVHFKMEGVHIAVCEAGRGGRTDSTTALQPDLLVLTNIGRDHIASLGATPEKRAQVKAGGLQPGACLINGLPYDSPEWGVANGIARTRGATTYSLGRNLFFRGEEWSAGQRQVQAEIRRPGKETRQARLRYRSRARFLDSNAALALGALMGLAERHPALLQDEQPQTTTTLTVPRGRFDILRQDPPLVLDGALSPEAVQALLRAWRDTFGQVTPNVLLALGRDKEAPAIMESLRKGSITRVHLLQVDSHRGLPADELAPLATAAGLTPTILTRTDQAIQLLTTTTEPWLVTGSLYLVGLLLAHAAGQDPLRPPETSP